MVGVDPQRFFEARHRGSEIAPPRVHDAKIVVKIGVGGLEAQRFEELLDRLIDVPLLGLEAAEVVVGPREILRAWLRSGCSCAAIAK